MRSISFKVCLEIVKVYGNEIQNIIDDNLVDGAPETTLRLAVIRFCVRSRLSVLSGSSSLAMVTIKLF